MYATSKRQRQIKMHYQDETKSQDKPENKTGSGAPPSLGTTRPGPLKAGAAGDRPGAAAATPGELLLESGCT